MASSTDLDPSDDDTRGVKSELRSLTVEEASDLDRTRRSDRTDKLLVDADRRDDDATARDTAADDRERAADRLSFADAGADYVGHRARREAALDRRDAKNDRKSSAEDRAQLTEGLEAGSADGEADSDPIHEPNAARDARTQGGSRE